MLMRMYILLRLQEIDNRHDTSIPVPYLTLEPPYPVLVLIRPRFDDPSPLSLLLDQLLVLAAGVVLLANRPPDDSGAAAACLGVAPCHQLPAGRSQSQKERRGGGTYASG